MESPRKGNDSGFSRNKPNQTEPAIESARKYNSTMMWTNVDTGKIYRLDEATGEQVICDSRGIPIKPFNPKITGRYNYDDRKKAIAKARADLSPVELPVTLKPSLKRNYVPQNQRLDGYA